MPRYRAEGEGTINGYITDPGRETELVAFPNELAAILGFAPAVPFLPAMAWD